MTRLTISSLAVAAVFALGACGHRVARTVVPVAVDWRVAVRVLEESKSADDTPEPVALEEPREESHTERPEAPARDAVATGADKPRFHAARTTAYFHGEADHLGFGCRSATGAPLRYGARRSAAADWSRYPVGTRFRIVGDRDACEYRVDDYGQALVGTDTIDLYKPTRSAMDAWGARDVVIEVLEWGSFEESLRILRPRARYPHVRRMVEAIGTRRTVAVAAAGVE